MKNLTAAVKDDGTVLVEGEEVGRLDGFVFYPTVNDGKDAAAILAAARRGLPDEIELRVRAFVASADPAFRLGEDGTVSWRESVVARLVRGDSLYAPRPELVFSDLLSTDQLQRMNDRLAGFVTAHVATVLGRLLALESPDPVGLPTRAPAADTPTKDGSAGVPTSDDGPVADGADGSGQAAAAPVALGGAGKDCLYPI